MFKLTKRKIVWIIVAVICVIGYIGNEFFHSEKEELKVRSPRPKPTKSNVTPMIVEDKPVIAEDKSGFGAQEIIEQIKSVGFIMDKYKYEPYMTLKERNFGAFPTRLKFPQKTFQKSKITYNVLL